MASVGPQSAGAGASSTASGGSGATWFTTSGVTTSDDTRAYIAASLESGGGLSQWLVVSSFDFSAIPDGSTIDGIVVEWEKGTVSGADMYDQGSRIVKGGTIGATDKAAVAAWPGSDAYVSYGSASDLWGETWATADIKNSGFGAALRARNDDPAFYRIPHVDHCRITVYYTQGGKAMPPIRRRRFFNRRAA